jgi:hypothetical protein
MAALKTIGWVCFYLVAYWAAALIVLAGVMYVAGPALEPLLRRWHAAQPLQVFGLLVVVVLILVYAPLGFVCGRGMARYTRGGLPAALGFAAFLWATLLGPATVLAEPSAAAGSAAAGAWWASVVVTASYAAGLFALLGGHTAARAVDPQTAI